MKQLTFLIILLIVFASGFVVSRYWYSDRNLVEVVEELINKPEEEVQEVEEIPVVSETSPAIVVSLQEEVEQALKAAFAAKYSKDPSAVRVSVAELTQEHASGAVSFDMEVGGGWFLAAKESGTWKLVADGNGIVLCSLVEPYDFPVSMVPECWDEDSMSLITF